MMWRLRQRSAPRSLAAVQTGETLAITRILGAPTRDLCHALGLHEGDVLVCREAARFHLWLEKGDGSLVGVERDHARYVEVIVATGSTARAATPTSEAAGRSRRA